MEFIMCREKKVILMRWQCLTRKTKKTYFISDSDFENSTSIVLRLEASKNCQSKGVRMAEEFLKMK